MPSSNARSIAWELGIDVSRKFSDRIDYFAETFSVHPRAQLDDGQRPVFGSPKVEGSSALDKRVSGQALATEEDR